MNGGASSSAFHRAVIHRMGRRCRNWDYLGTGTYLITIVLNDRQSAALGSVSLRDGKPAFDPSPLGAAIADHAQRISEFSPEIELIAAQLMPDHIHFILRVTRRLAKPLGEHLRGFKIGCTKIARSLSPACSPIHGRVSSTPAPCPAPASAPACSPIHGRVPSPEASRGGGLFADGFTDTILFTPAALEKAIAYLADNPRRLWEKRAHPELFRQLIDLPVRLAIDGKAIAAHFSAIGNSHLLNCPHLLQVQCSRRDFSYARDALGEIDKLAPPALRTARFEERLADSLAAASHGAVLVSPCISHGEKEIARRAFEAGYKVIVLQNKGFSPLFKPGGKLFDHCAAGNLLMLAPAAWPYLPGNKPITRLDACVLNRAAQLLVGEGAAEINYHGAKPADIDRLVCEALCARPRPLPPLCARPSMGEPPPPSP